MTASQHGKYCKLQIMDCNGIWHAPFVVLKYFCKSSLYVTSICQNFVSCPVQAALGVHLGFGAQWIVYF